MVTSELRRADVHEFVARRLDVVRARIASAGGSPDEVTILAVTKGFGVDAVEAALQAGLADIGENYAQELHAKSTAVASRSGAGGCRWHFLGHVQRNKVRALVPLVHLWQGVDRLAAGTEIARRAGAGAGAAGTGRSRVLV